MLDLFRVINTRLGSNVRTVLANLVGFGTTGDDENAERHDDCEVVQPIGLVSRPVLDADTEALVYDDGDERVVLGFVRKSSTLHDCETGETQLYGDKEPSCRVRCRASGKMEAFSKDGQDLVLNAGTKKVARVDDTVDCGNLQFLPNAGTAAAVLNYYPPGTPVVPLPGSTVYAVSGKITSGADRVKA